MPDMNAVQDELMDMIIADESPSNISDRIKDMLYSKSADKVNAFKPEVATKTFNDYEDTDLEKEVEAETTPEPSGEE